MYQNVPGHTPDSALLILTDKFLPPPSTTLAIVPRCGFTTNSPLWWILGLRYWAPGLSSALMAVIGARSFGLKLILSDSADFWMKIGTVSVYVYRRDSFCNGSKMSFSYWSCFLCIDCEPLDNTRICQTDDEVWRLSALWHQHVSGCQTTRGQSHVSQSPASCLLSKTLKTWQTMNTTT